MRSRCLARADAAAVARCLWAGSSAGARPLLRGGLGSARRQAVRGQRARRSSRGVLCRVVSALRGQGVEIGCARPRSRGACCVSVPLRRAGVRVGGRAPSVARRHLRCGRRAACGRGVWRGCARPRLRGPRLRRGPFEAGGCACRRSGAVCCAPAFAARSLLRVQPRCWGRVCASSVARRVCVAVPLSRAGVRVGGREPSVARRPLRCGRCSACGRGVGGGCARPRSRGAFASRSR